MSRSQKAEKNAAVDLKLTAFVPTGVRLRRPTIMVTVFPRSHTAYTRNEEKTALR